MRMQALFCSYSAILLAIISNNKFLFCNSCIMEAPRRVINVIHIAHLLESKMVELGKIPSGMTSITVKLEIMEPEITE